MNADALPRRDRKHALTRLGLLDALLSRMVDRPLEEIGVRELCEAVDISEPTFFNHFPTKTDVLVYFVQLWSIEAAWHAREAAASGPRAAIEAIFRLTARQITPNPRVMAEIIAFQARMSRRPELRPVTLAERLLRFPTLAGVEQLDAQPFEALVGPYVRQAIETGELPPRTDPRAVGLALASTFFGVPLLLGPTMPAAIEPAYLQMMALTWRGLRALAHTKESVP